MWLAALLASLGVTVLSLGGPSIRLHIPSQLTRNIVMGGSGYRMANTMSRPRAVARAVRRTMAAGVSPRALVGATSPTSAPIRAWPSSVPLMPMIWAVGLVVVIGRVIAGHLSLARIVALGRPITDADWQRSLFHAAVEVGAARPVRIFASDTVKSPITSGVLRPVVVLPAEASQWDEERRRVVLVHELAHVARGDYASQLLATLATALFWFHPLVWLAAARLRAEAEFAADDIVLTSGTNGVDYATHLLELARHERSLHLAAAVAVGMIRSTRLEGRFRAMLDSDRPRAAVSPATQLLVVLLALAVFIPLGGVRVTANAMSVRAMGPRVIRAVRPTPATPAIAVRIVVPVVQQVPVLQRSADSTFEKMIDAASGDRLVLDLRTGGNIILHGWNEPRVRLRARLGGRDWRETTVRLERVGREVRLRSELDRGISSSSTSHSFELWVPRSVDVDIASAGGLVSIDNLNGDISGYSGGGGIDIVSSSGSVSLSTGGGDIAVSKSDLSGTVSTGGGAVTISEVTGGLRGSSGSGPVISSLSPGTVVSGVIEAVGGGVVAKAEFRGQRGRTVSTTTTAQYGGGGSVTTNSYPAERDVRIASTRGFLSGATSISKAGGAIRLSEMLSGGIVHTGGGEISIGSSRGLIDVSTGGGDIDLSNMGGDAQVSTGAGDVTIQIVNVDGTEHSVAVYSGKGRVVLEVPANLDARLDLETAYTDNSQGRTRINSDFSLSETETQQWDDRFGTPRKFVRGSATLGSGRGLIRVRTVNGDIVVRRR
jgi:beta-lactamase regulating signal transducer with metallopeptidase domain/DUF4097 and DUF4098 domain-containing protein YvlB